MRKNALAAAMFIVSLLLFCPGAIAENEVKNLIKLGKGDRFAKILVSGKAVEALGKIGDPKAKDVLIQGLKSEEFFIRAYAAEALGRLKDKAAIPYLKDLVNDKNYLVRILAVKALVTLGETNLETLLLSFLSDKDPAARTAVVGQLMDSGDKYAHLLFQMLLKEDAYPVREGIIKLLGENKFQPAREYIIQALKDENLYVRQAAIEAAYKIPGGKQSPVLEIKKLLTDKDTLVRGKVKKTLSLTGDKLLSKLFWQEIDDKDPYLRASSYIALANLKDINILPIVLKAIVDPENPILVKSEAARSLVILKPYVLETVKKSLMNYKKESLSIENLEINYKVNGQELTAQFVEALMDKKNPLHKDSPLIINQLSARLGLPVMRQALLQMDSETAAVSAYVLGELNDKDAVGCLIELCEKYGF